MKWLLLTALILQGVHLPAQSFEEVVDSNCRQVEGATIYSEAVYIEAAGDVVGFELALFKDGRALLFHYEGSIATTPIPLATQRTRANKPVNTTAAYKTFRGSSLPSQPVKLKGSIVNHRFVGTVQLDQAVKKVRLKEVDHLWGCQKRG